MCDKERIIDNKTKAKNIINLEYVWSIKVFLLTLRCKIKNINYVVNEKTYYNI